MASLFSDSVTSQCLSSGVTYTNGWTEGLLVELKGYLLNSATEGDFKVLYTSIYHLFPWITLCTASPLSRP